MNPRIVSVVSSPPKHHVPQQLAKEYARQMFDGKLPSLHRLLGVFDNSGIEARQMCVPPDWFYEPKSFVEKNNTYIEQATNLGTDAARKALAAAGVEPEQVGHLLFVSTTGFSTPSIDARLINELGLSPNITRLPVFGLGCAGGAMGLSQAAQYVRAHPDQVALLVNVELCTLTFQFHDYSKSNFVALALFADGIAAAVIAGAESGLEGPEILDSQSTIWPDSLDVMGWNFLNEGMQVVFSRRIPTIVREKARDNIDMFLNRHDLQVSDIEQFILHPGGMKVIEAYEEVLGLENGRTMPTREVLRRHGNMSSATLLYVLEEVMRSDPRENSLGLATALGPGFSAESLLLRF